MVVCTDVGGAVWMGLKGWKESGKGGAKGAERVGKYTRMQE